MEKIIDSAIYVAGVGVGAAAAIGFAEYLEENDRATHKPGVAKGLGVVFAAGEVGAFAMVDTWIMLATAKGLVKNLVG